MGIMTKRNWIIAGAVLSWITYSLVNQVAQKMDAFMSIPADKISGFESYVKHKEKMATLAATYPSWEDYRQIMLEDAQFESRYAKIAYEILKKAN